MAVYGFDTRQCKDEEEIASGMTHCANLTSLDIFLERAYELDLKLKMLKIDIQNNNKTIEELQKITEEYKKNQSNIKFYRKDFNNNSIR